MSKDLKKLYIHLSKDADRVALREKRYAEMAKYERRFAERDASIAKRKKQPCRIDDDLQEESICDAFYRMRLGTCHHYKLVAKKYRQMAKGV